MRRQAQSLASRELESILTSLLTVRILCYASEQPTTAGSIAQHLHMNRSAKTNRKLLQVLELMVSKGLLKAGAAALSGDRQTIQYSLTTKGCALLDVAGRHVVVRKRLDR